MAETVTYKILSKHIVSGALKAGNEIALKIDQTLTQDATGTMAYLQFEAMGIARVRTELSVSYVDHNTLQEGFENADDHRYLQAVAARYGVVFSRPGNGICHQVHLERFGKPGKTLLGSDSHTPTGGGLGMLAMGAGGLDVAVAMGGGAFYIIAPKVVKVELTGTLRPWVSAKDVILYVLSRLSTKGNVNKILEYCGTGLSALSIPERATIANMGAETGVTTSVFPSDEVTRLFLKAQGREHDWQQLIADESAHYDEALAVNLSKIVPMAAKPHSPGNVVPVADIAGLPVQQAAIGSCTNASFKDLMIAAGILKGKKIHANTSLIVAPGSKQVFGMIARNGALADIIASGARVMEAACGFCIGNGQAPCTEGVSARTNNRNFEGRSGTKDAQVYLVSPETAALSALAGEFVDPLACGREFPEVSVPAVFDVDDSMVIFPGSENSSVSIVRGPNIGLPPRNNPLGDAVSGVVALKVGDKITTDHIMPAGPRLKYRSNIKKYSEFVFEGVDPTFAGRAAALKEQAVAVYIVAGSSYGQGSSREHAAMCPMYLGVKAVIAKSFERIHAANLINFGILPLTFSRESDYDIFSVNDAFEIKAIGACFEADMPFTITVPRKRISMVLTYALSRRQKDILKAGGLLNYTKS